MREYIQVTVRRHWNPLVPWAKQVVGQKSRGRIQQINTETAARGGGGGGGGVFSSIISGNRVTYRIVARISLCHPSSPCTRHRSGQVSLALRGFESNRCCFDEEKTRGGEQKVDGHGRRRKRRQNLFRFPFSRSTSIEKERMELSAEEGCVSLRY